MELKQECGGWFYNLLQPLIWTKYKRLWISCIDMLNE